MDDQENEWNEPLAFIHGYCDFSLGSYILMGLTRNKENKGDFHHFTKRYVLNNSEDVQKGYNELKCLSNVKDTVYRMYLSANARDTAQAIFHFQQRLAEIGELLYKGSPDGIGRARKIDSQWKSELCQKRNRATKRHLLDIDEDDKELFDNILSELEAKTTIHAGRKTPNGYVIVYDGCDIRQLKEDYGNRELDWKDDNEVFVERWEV
jgi:hypothetical protein